MSELHITWEMLLVGVVVFLLGGGLAAITLLNLRGRAPETPEQKLMRELSDMRRERDAQVAALQARINELQQIVNTLAARLAEAQFQIDSQQERIHQMELERAGTVRRINERRAVARPLLVVCGDDPQVAGQDLAVLDGIGVRYTRLWQATEETVADEVRRAQEDGRPYRWAVVSAHAGAVGVKLDKIVPPQWWTRNFGGFEAVLLAACSTTNVADALRDKAGFVAYFKEDVNSVKASLFVQRFVQRLNAGDEPETAFTSACDSVPEVASYADFRRRPGQR